MPDQDPIDATRDETEVLSGELTDDEIVSDEPYFTSGNEEVIYGEVVAPDRPVPSVDNTRPDRITEQQGLRTRRAVALRLAGMSYDHIAEQLNYKNGETARTVITREMKKLQADSTNTLRKVQFGRLEHMLMLLWPDVNRKDPASMQLALSIMDRIERMQGLAAPTKSEVTHTSSKTVVLADGDKDQYLKALQSAVEDQQSPVVAVEDEEEG